MTGTLVKEAVEHAHANHDAYLEDFIQLLRIPSISTDPAYAADIQRAAQWIVTELERLGFERCAAMPTERHPVVYGEWLKAGPDKPTVLIYAHYDVQPPDPLELWASPPFEPDIRDGKLYARGVIDGKIGVSGNLMVFQSILGTAGVLPINIKVMFEGEEETGSPSMEPFVKANKELLGADLLLLCEGVNFPDRPQSHYAVRGAIAAEVTVTGPQTDIHSGLGGGAVHNPLHVAGEIIASFHDKDGHVQIPGFYEGVVPLTEAEREQFDALEEEIVAITRQAWGDFRLWGEPGYNFVERTTARPSLDVNGMYGGYQGEGIKTIIPSKAGFKVSMRLAPNQDPDVIAEKFEEHVMRFTCDTVDVDVAIAFKARPALMLREGPVIDALKQAFDAVWGKDLLLMRTGGSVPIVGMFQQELGMPMTSLGLCNGGQVHAPNEYLDLNYHQTNIDTALHFYYYLAEALADQ